MWGIDPFDIYTVDTDGKNLKRLTNYNTHTAEGSLSPDGKRIVFTSLKGGDLDIYTMNSDGSDQKQITRLGGATSDRRGHPMENASFFRRITRIPKAAISNSTW